MGTAEDFEHLLKLLWSNSSLIRELGLFTMSVASGFFHASRGRSSPLPSHSVIDSDLLTVQPGSPVRRATLDSWMARPIPW